jgi:hypothetical protein
LAEEAGDVAELYLPSTPGADGSGEEEGDDGLGSSSSAVHVPTLHEVMQAVTE